jgi:hypothetical protein
MCTQRSDRAGSVDNDVADIRGRPRLVTIYATCDECTVTEVLGVLMMRTARAALCLTLCAQAVLAQGRPSPRIADSSTTQLMARVRSQAGAPWLRDLLRHVGTPYPQSMIDRIADSLMTRALEATGNDQRSAVYMGAGRALNALAEAGTRGPRPGRPVAGMLDRLITVHQRSRSPTIRIFALDNMLVAVDHARAVDYLRRVAESNDSTALFAIHFLISDSYGGSTFGVPPTDAARQHAVSALNALAAGGRVIDGRAAMALGSWVYMSTTQRPRSKRQ